MIQMLLPRLRIKPDPTQSRTQNDPEADKALLESVRQYGILQAVGVVPVEDWYRLIWGYRRFNAAVALGHKDVPVVLLDQAMTEGEFVLMQQTENNARADLSLWDRYHGLENAAQLNPCMTNKDLAQRIGLTDSMIGKIRKLKDLIPEAMQLVKERKLGIKKAYALAVLAPEVQKEFLGCKTTEAGEKHEEGNGTVPPTKNRVRVDLGWGVTLGVTASDEIDMVLLIDALGRSLKAARKTKDSGGDVRAWQSLMSKATNGKAVKEPSHAD